MHSYRDHLNTKFCYACIKKLLIVKKAVDEDETNGDDLLTDGSRRGTNGPG